MSKKKNSEFMNMSKSELVKKYFDLVKKKIILTSQSNSGSPPKNNQELKNVKRDIARVLTFMKQKGYGVPNLVKKA